MIAPEHLVLLWILAFCGTVALGYLVGHLWPLEVLRALLGAAPPGPPPADDLRQLVRQVLGAPPAASDLDLAGTLFEMRRQADRHCPQGESPR